MPGTLNTSRGALIAPNSPQPTNAGYTPLPSAGLNIATLPNIPKPVVPPPRSVTVATPEIAAADLGTKKTTTDATAQALQQQTQAKLGGNVQQPQQGEQPQQQTPQGGQPAQTGPTNATANTTTDILNLINQGGKLTPEQAKQIAGLDFTGVQQNEDGTYTFDSSAVQRADEKNNYTQPGTTTGDPTTDYINGELTKNQATLDSASTAFQSSMQQLLTGNFPLTADQQAQVVGLQSQFDQLRSLQETANKNYENGINLMGIREGRQQYTPALAATEIHKAITGDLQKIAQIDIQAASSVASLKQGFLDKDYDVINNSYAALQKSVEQKNATLAQIQKTVSENIANATAKINQEKATLDLQETKVNDAASSALREALKVDGTLDLDAIQRIADEQGLDPNVLYGAVRKAQQEEVQFQQDESKFASDQLQAQATLANTKATTAKTYTDIAKTNQDMKFAADANSPSTDDFAATVDKATNLYSSGSVAAQRSFKESISSAIAQKDYASAYDFIKQATAKGLDGTNKTKFEDAAIDQQLLKLLSDRIEAYKAAGGDINFVKAAALDAGKKVGVLATDKPYAALAGEIDSAFQQYRQNMTGAAFGAGESADYQKVRPSKSGSFNLNEAVLQGALNYANDYVSSTISSKVGQGGNYIKDYAERTTTAPDGQEVIITD